MEYEIDGNKTIEDLKKIISEETSIGIDRIRLIF